jgi:hypothetical protein
MNTRKMRGNNMILVISLPKRKSDKPKTRKNIEKPDIEKT